MAPQVEELPDNKVRITVDVPREDVHHAVEHAASVKAMRLAPVSTLRKVTGTPGRAAPD